VRTPLASIIGFAEVMRTEALGPIENPKYKGYLQDILESAHHALSLINDLLDLSRIRAGALTLDIVELDVNATIGASLATLQPQADKAGITLRSQFQTDLPHLIADRRSLKQMLLNLVGNAIKFTPAGGSVTVTTTMLEAGDLVLAVADTGEGMTAAEIELALVPFRQVGSVPGRYGGTGLGLPLTKALAEANGAQLDVSSQPGAGTTMRLRFAPGRTVPV
jgi:signal transduction histidine kinase